MQHTTIVHPSSQDACRARSLGQAQVCLRNEAPTACRAWHSIYCWRRLYRPNSQPCCPMQHTMTSGQATETTAQQQLSEAHSKGQARQHPGCQTLHKGPALRNDSKTMRRLNSTALPGKGHRHRMSDAHTYPPTPQPHTPALTPPVLRTSSRNHTCLPLSQIQHSQSHTADRRGSTLSPPLITRTPQGPRLTYAHQGCANHAGACTLQPCASSSLARGTRVGD